MDEVIKTTIQTEFGAFEARYHQINGAEHVSFSYGDIANCIPVVRMHSSCLFSETFHSIHCDCSRQLTETMKAIVQNGSGVIVYSYQEGRGIGIEKKIEAMEIQRLYRLDTVEAFKKLGFERSDFRDYANEICILKKLNVNKRLYTFSGNPHKRAALERAGFHVEGEYETLSFDLNPLALSEKKIKASKMGYTYKEF